MNYTYPASSHLPRAATVVGFSLEEPLQRGCSRTWNSTSASAGPASFFKGPLDQGWAGHTGIKDATQRKVSCSPEHWHMLRQPPLERILARNKLPLHPHFSAPPSLGCKQERPFSPLWALLDPPALHWVSFPVYFIHLKARSKPSARLRDLSPTCILGVIAREGVLVHARMLSSTPTPSTLCHIIPP